MSGEQQKSELGEFQANSNQNESGENLMEVDSDYGDYDGHESQPTRQMRLKARRQEFGTLPFHPSMVQRTSKHAGPQMREEAGDILATLVGFLNRDIKKINRLSSAISAQRYINDKHLENRFDVREQDLDENEETPKNVVVYDKKKNAIYSVDGYTTAVGFGDDKHPHKRNWKKQYYTDVDDVHRAALAAKLKASGIKGGPYMKWLSITKPHKEIKIKPNSFRAYTVKAKDFINQNGGSKLPMATKQQIMASAWNSVFIAPAIAELERQEGKIDLCNRNNKTKLKVGDYQYYPVAKRVYQKELPAVIATLQSTEGINASVGEALQQAMGLYGQNLAQRQREINAFKLDKYNFQ
ncbi:MAG: hypothetical protein EZS28_006631 [Streblomastix strix]|uniref:Uncharacterized protein n=1 Tax=Streblomastix strix TaxID=222440 RepID=A0A5J4WTY8_9EUKA|nr:MAG: hypothetical protein EZS28_006631 [Streblomastix strix]